MMNQHYDEVQGDISTATSCSEDPYQISPTGYIMFSQAFQPEC